MRLKNRLENYYKLTQTSTNNKALQFIKSRLELEEKLNNHMKESIKHQQETKLKNKIKYESSLHRKKGDTLDIQQKLHQLMVKLKHNENNIKNCKI